MREAMIDVAGSGSFLQLLAPLRPDSPIGKFLARSGEGMQQLAFRVTDIDVAGERLRAAGVRLLYDVPKTRHGRLPGQLRAPQGLRRRPRRAGRAGRTSRPRTDGSADARLPHPVGDPCLGPGSVPRRRPRVTSRGYRAVTFKGTPVPTSLEVPCSRSSTRSWPMPTASPASTRSQLPETYRAVTVHKDEEQMFAGMQTRDKDPRKSLHLDDVPVPELGPGEALVAVMASAVNYNTVWTSIFEPVSTFGFLSPLRPHPRARQAPRPAVPRRRLRPGRRRAAHRPRRATPGSPATRSSRTA